MNTTRYKECRIAMGYGQKEIAYKLGVSLQTISYWENGKRQPSREMLVRLAEIYNVSVDYLLGDQAPQPVSNVAQSTQNLRNAVVQKLTDLTDEQLIELKGYLSGRFGK